MSSCGTCRFWKEIPREIGDQNEPAGKCKWGPPVRVAPKAAAWPTTPASEFCFRWEDNKVIPVAGLIIQTNPLTGEPTQRLSLVKTAEEVANDPNAVARQAAGQAAAVVPPADVPPEPQPVIPPADRPFDNQIAQVVKQVEAKEKKK